jgi:hypothetical protein
MKSSFIIPGTSQSNTGSVAIAPDCSVFFTEKPNISQLVKNFPINYGNRRFATLLTRTHNFLPILRKPPSVITHSAAARPTLLPPPRKDLPIQNPDGFEISISKQ